MYVYMSLCDDVYACVQISRKVMLIKMLLCVSADWKVAVNLRADDMHVDERAESNEENFDIIISQI